MTQHAISNSGIQAKKVQFSPLIAKVHPKATIMVSNLVRETCSVYLQKGRLNSTASKLMTKKGKCTRIAREL